MNKYEIQNAVNHIIETKYSIETIVQLDMDNKINIEFKASEDLKEELCQYFYNELFQDTFFINGNEIKIKLETISIVDGFEEIDFKRRNNKG